ncbi:hypothetical protein Tco_1518781 [Tanacetum coccineum]
MKKSPLDFADEDVQTDVMGEHQTDNPVSTTVPQQEQPAAESAATEVPPETNLEQEVLTMGPPVNKRRMKRDRGETGSNASSKVFRTKRGTAANTQSVSEPEPLSFAVPRPTPEPDVAQSSKTTAVEDEDTEKFSAGGSHYSTRVLLRDAPPAFRGLPKPIQHQHDTAGGKIRNLESLIEAESDMKRAAEAKNETLTKELEDIRAHFSKLQVDSEQLTQQVATLQAQVTEMDARLDALSSDFDEELYPHMLTAIAGHRWMIGHGLRLAVMKCAESMELRQAFADVVTAIIAKGLSDGLKDGVEHGKAGLDLASLEGHDSEANEKFNAALQALKDLKYPLVDELE